VEKQNIDEQVIGKLPWVAPQLTILNVNLINQQAMEQEVELLNMLANDENAFRLFSGSASDYRLKEAIKDFNGLSLVNQLQAYHYAWKNGSGQEYGVLAHELQAIFPYMVSGKKDEVDAEGNPVIQRVNYSKLIPVLLKALQEQQEMIDELKKQILEIKHATNQI
jgi:hypothetical protein